MSSKVVVKGYQVGVLVDQAGMRSLYRALRLSSGKEMFVTVVKVRPGRSLKALVRRAQQSKRLTHPGLVPAVDYGVVPDDRFFYSHEAIASLPVKRVVADVSDPAEKIFIIVRYMLDVAELVDYIHSSGTTHRDLATQYVRIDRYDRVHLEGFINARPKVEPRNIANIVNLPYMSPEQLIGTIAADRKTDIYSLGTIFFELVTGRVPYESNHAKIEDVRQGIVPTPSMFFESIPSALEAIIMKMLAPRGSRYRHVQEVLKDLEAFYSKRSLRMRLNDFTQTLRKVLVGSRVG